MHTAEGHSDDWDFDALWTELKTLYPISITVDEVLSEAGTRGRVTTSFLTKEILSDAGSPTSAASSRSASRPCASSSAALCSR